MKKRTKYELFLFLFLLITMTSCGQKQEKEGEKKSLQKFEGLNDAINETKQYMGQLDSALFQLSVFENNLDSQDSAKRSIRSRDQDMVRIYKIEKEPIVDTSSVALDHLINEAQMVLEKSNSLLKEAAAQVGHSISQENRGAVGAQAEGVENRDAHLKKINRLIDRLETQAGVLEKQLNSIDEPSR